MPEDRAVSPAALRDALSGAGFVVAGRGASYTRWQWAAGDDRRQVSLTVPDDDRFADADDLIGDVLAALHDAARRGEQARQALDLLAEDVGEPLSRRSPDVPVESAPAAMCCELHNTNCEPPSELCCGFCTEVRHPEHGPGVVCVLDAARAAKAGSDG